MDTETETEIVGDPVETFNVRKVKKLPVMEMFGPTLQGEGAMIGVRTMFIRFGLCDYKCKMCDSMHAVDPLRVKANAHWMTPEEINEEMYRKMNHGGSMHTEWITLSGGNPCIHDLTELLMRFRGWDILGGEPKIAVETQGTLLPDWLHMCDVITVSPKSPGMGEQFEQDKFIRFVMQFKHHPGFNVKVVVFSAMDIEWAKSINGIMLDEGLGDKMYLSLGNPFPPGSEAEDNLSANVLGDKRLEERELKFQLLENYRQLTEDLLQDPFMSNVKFLPQMHVLTWANKMGV